MSIKLIKLEYQVFTINDEEIVEISLESKFACKFLNDDLNYIFNWAKNN